MKITMLETRLGSEDGYQLRQYQKGKNYDVADLLGGHFLKRNWAVKEIEILPEGTVSERDALVALRESFSRDRKFWLCEAAHFARHGDLANQRYCQGRAAELDNVIVVLSGEGINLSLTQFAEPATASSTTNHHFKD